MCPQEIGTNALKCPHATSIPQEKLPVSTGYLDALKCPRTTSLPPAGHCLCPYDM